MASPAGGRRVLIGVLILGGSACAARSAPANLQSASPPNDWAVVMRVAGGSQLKVDATLGSIAGRLVSVENDQLTLLRGTTCVAVSRRDVKRIVLVQRRTIQKAKRGFAVGAIAGALMGTLGTKSNQLIWSAFLAASWGGLGALIGAIDGASAHGDTVVYVGSPQIY